MEEYAMKYDRANYDFICANHALYLCKKEQSAKTEVESPVVPEEETDGLQLVTSSLSAEQERLLRLFLIRRLTKGALYTGTGTFSGMDFSLSGSSPAVCYYILLECQALVCLLAMPEANLEVFRPELAHFCQTLAPQIKGPDISIELSSWHVVCLLYVGRVVQALGPHVASLLQLAQQNGNVTAASSVDAVLVADVQRFLSTCAVAEFLHLQPAGNGNATLKPGSIAGEWEISGVECNAYCAEWGRLLLEHGHTAEPWCLRKVLEAFKLKTIKEMNMLKRLLKQSETDHYSLYRAYSFLWQSGNGNILLHQARLEGGSSPAVLDVLEQHLATSTAM